jgi:hypothetical protein
MNNKKISMIYLRKILKLKIQNQSLFHKKMRLKSYKQNQEFKVKQSL